MTHATAWRSETYEKKMKQEKLRRSSNPFVAIEVHMPNNGPHVGPGRDWVKQIEDKPDDLTLEMVAKCQEMFTQFDKNRDGFLDISDLGPLLRSMGPTYNPSELELEQLKERFLPTDAERFELKDYLRIIVKVPQERADEASLTEAFRAFDTSGIGVVSAEQLRTAMLNMGEGMSEEEVQDMLLSVEIDKRGEIDYKELIKLMLSE